MKGIDSSPCVSSYSTVGSARGAYVLAHCSALNLHRKRWVLVTVVRWVCRWACMGRIKLNNVNRPSRPGGSCSRVRELEHAQHLHAWKSTQHAFYSHTVARSLARFRSLVFLFTTLLLVATCAPCSPGLIVCLHLVSIFSDLLFHTLQCRKNRGRALGPRTLLPYSL